LDFEDFRFGERLAADFVFLEVVFFVERLVAVFFAAGFLVAISVAPQVWAPFVLKIEFPFGALAREIVNAYVG
jgi:hypothetical protein